MSLPRTFAFTAADGTDLVTYSSAFAYSKPSGSAGMQIISNHVLGLVASVENLAIVNGETFSADHYAEAKVVAVGSRKKGLTGRMDTLGNGYAFYGKGPSSYGNRYLVIETLRVPTTLASDTTHMAINAIIRLECAGSAQTCKEAGVSVLTGTDATYATGKPGLAFPDQSSNAELDDLTVDNLGGGAASALKRTGLLNGLGAFGPFFFNPLG